MTMGEAATVPVGGVAFPVSATGVVAANGAAPGDGGGGGTSGSQSGGNGVRGEVRVFRMKRRKV